MVGVTVWRGQGGPPVYQTGKFRDKSLAATNFYEVFKFWQQYEAIRLDAGMEKGGGEEC